MATETNVFQMRTPSSSSDEFPRLLRRYLVLVSQLRLASKDFGDLSGLPTEHVAAALVVQEASTELLELHDKLHAWHGGQHGVRNGAAASDTDSVPVTTPRVSLVLNGYALEKKVNVIRVLREVVPEFSLTTAKALLERELPTRIADGLDPEEAEAMRQKFEAAGASCRITAR
jgi:ribosomal protein L7/L12